MLTPCRVMPVGFERFSKLFGLFTAGIVFMLVELMVERSVAVKIFCWLCLCVVVADQQRRA